MTAIKLAVAYRHEEPMSDNIDASFHSYLPATSASSTATAPRNRFRLTAIYAV